MVTHCWLSVLSTGIAQKAHETQLNPILEAVGFGSKGGSMTLESSTQGRETVHVNHDAQLQLHSTDCFLDTTTDGYHSTTTDIAASLQLLQEFNVADVEQQSPSDMWADVKQCKRCMALHAASQCMRYTSQQRLGVSAPRKSIGDCTKALSDACRRRVRTSWESSSVSPSQAGLCCDNCFTA